MAEEKTTENGSMDPKTSAILAWFFAPITSIIWMNEKDEFLRYHAKQSLSWSLVSIAVYVVCTVTAFLIIPACFAALWAILDIVVRIYGIVKANNGEKWEVPVVGNLIK